MQVIPSLGLTGCHQRVFSPIPLGEKQGTQVLSPGGDGPAFNGPHLATAGILS